MNSHRLAKILNAGFSRNWHFTAMPGGYMLGFVTHFIIIVVVIIITKRSNKCEPCA